MLAASYTVADLVCRIERGFSSLLLFRCCSSSPSGVSIGRFGGSQWFVDISVFTSLGLKIS